MKGKIHPLVCQYLPPTLLSMFNLPPEASVAEIIEQRFNREGANNATIRRFRRVLVRLPKRNPLHLDVSRATFSVLLRHYGTREGIRIH